MNLDVNAEELRLLTDLVESRIRELHPEIRRSMETEYKERLKHELECWEGMQERLRKLVGRPQ